MNADQIFEELRDRWQADLKRASETGDWSNIHNVTMEEWEAGEAHADSLRRSEIAKQTYERKKQEIARLARREVLANG